MNTTPEERLELRKQHSRSRIGACWTCLKPYPCLYLRLLDDADEADALRARAEAAEAKGEWAWQLAQSMVPPEALKVAEQQVEAAEADNAALLERFVPDDCCAYAGVSGHVSDCPYSQPHPGDALLERLRLAEAVVAAARDMGGIDMGTYEDVPLADFELVKAALAAYDACEAGQ